MRKLMAIAVGVLLVLGASYASADTIIGQESSTGGFVGPIPGSGIIVASDGESFFDPFGFGADTSDGIRFDGDPDLIKYVGAPGWVQIPGTSAWVLPADLSSIGCGGENETNCEPLGQWHLGFGAGGLPETGVPSINAFIILSSSGAVSDRIIVNNNGDGTGSVTFASDPLPEPGTLLSLVIGLLGLGGAMRRRIV